MEKISDLVLATTLVSLGHKITHLERDSADRKRVNMYFDKNNSLESDINDFWNGDSKVNPKSFGNHMRDIKTRVSNTN